MKNPINTVKMKKAITLFVLLNMISVACLKAQDFIPVVEDGKRWNVLHTLEGPSPSPQHRTTTSYILDGDTILDGIAYKKLFATTKEELVDLRLKCVMRETPEGQVYYRNVKPDHTIEGYERTLYDFSLQPGDIVCIIGNNLCMSLVAVHDTVYGTDGVTRRVQLMQYIENGTPRELYETWVEGIGSNLGLLNVASLSMVGGEYNLLCHYEDGDLIWQNPDFNACYMITETEGLGESETETSASVHPNPAKDFIRIEGTDPLEVRVCNAFGQTVKTVRNTKEISISDLPSGVYFVSITDREGRTCVKKVVKE